jgi:hypothetical protein
MQQLPKDTGRFEAKLEDREDKAKMRNEKMKLAFAGRY